MKILHLFEWAFVLTIEPGVSVFYILSTQFNLIIIHVILVSSGHNHKQILGNDEDCYFKFPKTELRCKNYKRSEGRFSFFFEWPHNPSHLCTFSTGPRTFSIFWAHNPISSRHMPYWRPSVIATSKYYNHKYCISNLKIKGKEQPMYAKGCENPLSLWVITKALAIVVPKLLDLEWCL